MNYLQKDEETSYLFNPLINNCYLLNDFNDFLNLFIFILYILLIDNFLPRVDKDFFIFYGTKQLYGIIRYFFTVYERFKMAKFAS